MGSRLLLRLGASMFFLPSLCCGTPVALGHLQAVVGQLAARGTGFAQGDHDAILLASGDQQQRCQPPAPGRYNPDPGHAAISPPQALNMASS
ncbi:hypothetical protein D3C80_1743150 [compost metagenome]